MRSHVSCQYDSYSKSGMTAHQQLSGAPLLESLLHAESRRVLLQQSWRSDAGQRMTVNRLFDGRTDVTVNPANKCTLDHYPNGVRCKLGST